MLVSTPIVVGIKLVSTEATHIHLTKTLHITSYESYYNYFRKVLELFSPGLHGKGAGQGVILPEAKWLQTEW